MNKAKVVTTTIVQYFKLSYSQGPQIEEEMFQIDSIPYAVDVGSIMYTMVCCRPALVMI